MRKLFLSIICTFCLLPLFGQDLIVTTSGDSIACLVIREKSTKVKIEQRLDNKVVQYYMSKQIIKGISRGYYTRLSIEDFDDSKASNSLNPYTDFGGDSTLIIGNDNPSLEAVVEPPRTPSIFFSVEYGANCLLLKDKERGKGVSSGGGFWKVNFSPIDLNGGSIGFTYMHAGTYSPSSKVGTESKFNAYLLSLRIGPSLRGENGSGYLDFGLGVGKYHLEDVGKEEKNIVDVSRFAASLSGGYVIKVVNGFNFVLSVGILGVYGSEFEEQYAPEEPDGYKYTPEVLALQLHVSLGIMLGH
ncbi:hypothetical protein K5X82_05840 [Halosquirtibacter xylanolyticus]|uniref:hypothetical protein n=1 Tax=Halosquirtibacter xylanolyticus TaxID=3374599 RepID=UPI003747CEB1|nr:hypothetical protein K5X82_05840 [Prolixibacteraceae bacterium]